MTITKHISSYSVFTSRGYRETKSLLDILEGLTDEEFKKLTGVKNEIKK